MDIELLDARAVSRCLKRLIEKHNQIHVAVAWGYNGPLADCVLENAQKFALAWYNVDRPSGEEAEIWDGRVAMLDAIFYNPS